MNHNPRCIAFLFLALCFSSAPIFSQTLEQAQAQYVDLRFGAFVHFNMGTFTDKEWADPKLDPALFNPTKLDCAQWADAFRSAGMTYAVLTTKHHDGFCLWDTRATNYSAMHSAIHADVLRAFVDAMRSRGIKPAIYFSIWDRTEGIEPDKTTTEKLAFIKTQLTELLTNYGEVPVIIFDGWAWKMGHQQVPYQEIRELVKQLQPHCLICDHDGQTEPWDVDVVMYEEPKGVFCYEGNTYCASQDQTISGGWFWHPSTPQESLMSRDSIVDHLNKLESRYCNFILNCPPNREGRLDDNIVKRLAEVGVAWKPNPARPPLPPQPHLIEHPVTAKSAQASSGDAKLAIDGINDLWNAEALHETLWKSDPKLSQWITLDLGQVYRGISMLSYFPPQAKDQQTAGQITSFRIWESSDGTNFNEAVSGHWPADKHLKSIEFPPVTARYIKLEVLDANGGRAAANEIGVGSRTDRPQPVN